MNEKYDVCVIGAGPSGIAAAVYAAKYGAKTVLLEKSSVIGGTALKAYVHTLKGTSLSGMDGLLSGITKKAWGNIIFQPEELTDRYYSLLKQYPVELISGCEVISAETDGSKISGVVFTGKEGKQTVSAKIFIDASGTQLLDMLTDEKDIRKQINCYMTGLIGKVETVGGRCYSQEAKQLLNEEAALAKEHGRLSRDFSFSIYPTVRADIALVSVRSDIVSVDGVKMRSFLNEAVEFMQSFGYGFENASLISASKEVFCMPRGNFSAKYTLTAQDIVQNTFFSDHIAALPDGDGVGEILYYIPMGSIISSRFENLMLCGANIGAAANAMELIDAIPTHFETGKAAGITASIAIKNNMRPEDVSSYEVISKSEDTVSDKIEILNESYEEDDETDIISTFNIEKESGEEYTLSFKSAFASKEKYTAESFEELDNALSMIGKLDVNEAKEKNNLQNIDSDLSMILDIDPGDIVKKENKVPDVEETMDELTSILESLKTVSDITPEKSQPAHVFETDEIHMPEDETSDHIKPNAEINDLPDAESLQSESAPEKEAIFIESPEDEIKHTPETVNEINSLGEGAYALPNLMDLSPQEDTSESLDAEETREPEKEAEQELPLDNSDILNGMMLNFAPQEQKDEKEPQKSIETPAEEKSTYPKNIVDSGYDSFFGEEPERPPYPKEKYEYDFSDTTEKKDLDNTSPPPVQKSTPLINQDVLSMLYDEVEDDLRDDIAQELNEPPISVEKVEFPDIQEKTFDEPTPVKDKKPAEEEKRDKVSSMLDMIYDITESQTEEPEQADETDFSDLEAMIPGPSMQNNAEEKAKHQNAFENTEKFKAIKDILYDNDDN